MNFKDVISRRVCDYYTANGPVYSQIAHTVSVAALTRQIALMQGRDERTVDLMEAAAWLHDIGCPDAIRKYGNSKPIHQMEEGERIVGEWFAADCDFPHWQETIASLSEEERLWLGRVVGTHHTLGCAKELHFEPLFEADLIVNIKEDYFGRSQADHLYETMLLSNEGREMFRRYIRCQ